MGSQLLTEAEVADRLRVARPTLRDWRTQVPPVGPPFVRLVGAIRYDTTDLKAWIEAQRVETVQRARPNVRGVERFAPGSGG